MSFDCRKRFDPSSITRGILAEGILPWVKYLSSTNLLFRESGLLFRLISWKAKIFVSKSLPPMAFLPFSTLQLSTTTIGLVITSWKLQRIIAGITQAELASRSQFALSRIRTIERGAVRPTKVEAEVLSRSLSLKPRKATVPPNGRTGATVRIRSEHT